MTAQPILRLGTVKDIARFEQHLRSLHLNVPCDRELASGSESPASWREGPGPCAMRGSTTPRALLPMIRVVRGTSERTGARVSRWSAF